MAYIIRDDYDDRLIKTAISFVGSEQALKDYFANTPANSYTINDASWVTGTPIPADVVPSKASITEGDAIADWRTMRGGATLVSGRFKDCIEAFDPGRHGFFPITVDDAQGNIKPGPYFVFHVVGYIDSIIEAESNLKASGRGDIQAWGYERKVGPWKCTLDASVIGDRSCWTELRYGLNWFISDRLAAALRDRNLAGFRLVDHCEERAV